ncbi:MAG: hypothetical protein CME71_02005 [Halobacteriovorax sp.]|nr:hypothetical protein [Halobacteriovorax sp.]
MKLTFNVILSVYLSLSLGQAQVVGSGGGGPPNNDSKIEDPRVAPAHPQINGETLEEGVKKYAVCRESVDTVLQVLTGQTIKETSEPPKASQKIDSYFLALALKFPSLSTKLKDSSFIERCNQVASSELSKLAVKTPDFMLLKSFKNYRKLNCKKERLLNQYFDQSKVDDYIQMLQAVVLFEDEL